MNHNASTRLMSFLLAVLMVVGLMPMTALAQEGTGETMEQTVPAATEETVPPTTEETVPPTTEETVPPTTEETVPPTTEETVPPTTEETVPPATEETVPAEYPEDVSFFTVNGFVSETHDVFKSTKSTIAPGVVQSINYAYAKDKKQMVYYVATADINRDDVQVHTSYKNADISSFGMDKLTAQMAAADAKYTNPDYEHYNQYFKAVAGVNGDFYNMSSGQPSGAFVMEGIMSSNKANNRPWFAIFEDGTALCGSNNAQWDAAVAAHGQVKEAVGGSQMLVVDGKDVTANASGSYNTDRHSRSMVGVTADNKVVIALLDGRQEPFSCGGTMHELAQIMLEQGCVMAINLDGGGSSTYAARPEGENAVRVINRPSDGSERSISSGLLVASTAAPSDVFERATLTAEHDYVTPGSTLTVTAVGVSPAGTYAEIPADVTYQTDWGTIDASGTFVAADEEGIATIQMVYEGNVVGETQVWVALPTELGYDLSELVVPYGKTVDITPNATYDSLNQVVLKPEDIEFILSDPTIGTINGFEFTAGELGAAADAATLTATVKGTGVSVEMSLKLGKASEILWDFEDGDVSDFAIKGKANYNYILTPGTIGLADAASGQVHSGNHALRAELQFSKAMEGGYISCVVGLNNPEVIDLGGATKFGMWVYFPVETPALNGRIYLREVTERDEEGNIVSYNTSSNTTDATLDGSKERDWSVGFTTSFEEAGWHYISFDLTQRENGFCIPPNAQLLDIYVSDRDNATYGYNHLDYNSANTDAILYIDDITLDYSSAVDDREAPIFESIRYADPTMSDAVALPKKNVITTGHSTISFGAVVHENTSLNNYTGLDESTARAYIDGEEVACTISGGIMSVADVVLADGLHTVKFSIRDNQGNYASMIRRINVQAGSGLPTVKLQPRDPSLDKLLMGSVYYVDLVATDLEKVSSVTVKLNLNNMSRWQLANLETAPGFQTSYTMASYDDNVAILTVRRTGSSAAGEGTLVSIPIRTWEMQAVVQNGTGKNRIWMYPDWKKGNELWPVDINLTVDAGSVRFVGGGSSTFSGYVQVDTELDSWFYNDTAARDAEYAAWNGGHDHRVEMHVYYAENATNKAIPVALPDKAATCTENGYTGRTFCETCQSVVEWGQTKPATGHSYVLTEGVLACSCGELFTGTWKDGKEYVDGVTMPDGWNADGTRYYVEGKPVTGIYLAGDEYHDFGEDGISKGVYTGVFFDEAAQAWRYSLLGVLSGGWYMIDDCWYYFDEATLAAVPGTWKDFFPGVTYDFEENGKLVTGVWVKIGSGYRYYYGPTHYVGGGNTATTSWYTIDGKTYCIDSNGHRYEGLHYVIDSNSTIAQWYDFGADGVLVGKLTHTGGLEANGKLYYLVNGISRYGLALIDGHYYYMNTRTYAADTGKQYAAFPNGLLPAADYVFGADGKLISTYGLRKDADGEIRYYVDDVAVYAGLVQDTDGSYYYINSSLKAVKNRSYTIYEHKTNGFLPAGEYTFGANGRMLTGDEEDRKNGLILDEDGEIRYYEDGVAVYIGLVMDENGDYYYINSSLKAVKSCTYTIYAHKTNGLLSAGEYTFGADGKLVVKAPDVTMKNGLVRDDDGEIRYYENDVAVYIGLVQDAEGNYYYINSSLKAVKNRTYTIYAHKTNGLLSAGEYTFGPDGKMVTEPEEPDVPDVPDVTVKNGLILDEDGEIRYYVDGTASYAGLVQDAEGNYYYINSSLKAVKNCAYNIYSHKTNGLLAAGKYSFGADGRMIR